MAELIPSINKSDLLKLNAKQLRRLKSCEVVSDGEYVGTWVNGYIAPGGYLRKQTEYKCQGANAVSGETLEEILEPVLT